MTALATILGLAPMALGLGEGSETNTPLARAVIGGLSVSTFLTLFLIPILYLLFERHGHRPERTTA
jgi:multidrug efflux pump subunit AcrB